MQILILISIVVALDKLLLKSNDGAVMNTKHNRKLLENVMIRQAVESEDIEEVLELTRNLENDFLMYDKCFIENWEAYNMECK